MDENDEYEDNPQSLEAHDFSSGATTSHPIVLAHRSRRAHKKSRNGCHYCKRRRIKCDETKPACGNCLRLSIPCGYAQPVAQPDTAAEHVVHDAPKRKRGRPPKNWTVVSVGSGPGPATAPGPNRESTNGASPSTSLSSLTLPSAQHLDLEKPLHIPWDAQDLELFFHYTTALCAGLGVGDAQLWRDRVPRLAFRRHSVLHLLLAASALHLSRDDADRRRQLEERAEMHFAIGLRRATEILPHLGAENCAELYIATILIFVCSLAKGPAPRHLFLVADGSEVAWWELFGGIRFVVESIGLSTVFAGELGPLPSEPTSGRQGEGSHLYSLTNLNVVAWEGPLGRLSSLVSSTPSQCVRDICQGVLGMMAWCFQETFGTTARPKPIVDAKFNTVMAWLYCLPHEFIENLKRKDPVPLVLLAHFAVLLQTLESAWFIAGWAVHVLRGVTEILGPSWSEWLEWPTLQIESAGAAVTPL